MTREQAKKLEATLNLPDARPEWSRSVIDLLLQVDHDAYTQSEKEIKSLRRLLWCAHNDGTGYADDGELQLHGMDFRRDSIDRIESFLTTQHLKSK